MLSGEPGCNSRGLVRGRCGSRDVDPQVGRRPGQGLFQFGVVLGTAVSCGAVAALNPQQLMDTALGSRPAGNRLPFSFSHRVLQCQRQNHHLRINSKAIKVHLQFLRVMLLCSSLHWQLFYNKFISSSRGKYFTVLPSLLPADRETVDPLAGKRGVRDFRSPVAGRLRISSMKEELPACSLLALQDLAALGA